PLGTPAAASFAGRPKPVPGMSPEPLPGSFDGPPPRPLVFPRRPLCGPGFACDQAGVVAASNANALTPNAIRITMLSLDLPRTQIFAHFRAVRNGRAQLRPVENRRPRGWHRS